MQNLIKSDMLISQIQNLNQYSTIIEYPDHTMVFWLGDPANSVYYIEQGAVRIFIYTDNGNCITFNVHQVGEMIGLCGPFVDQVRLVCAQTIGNTRLREFRTNEFNMILKEYPQFGIHVMRCLAHQVRQMNQTILRMGSMRLDRRIALTLLDQSQRVKTETGEPLLVKMTHQELADAVGACRQTTTTILNRFKQNNIVKTHQKAIEIIDIEALRQVANTTSVSDKDF